MLFVALICFGLHMNVSSQTLVSAQLKGTKTKAQISQAFSLPLIKYGAKFYKILYKSPDAKGQPDTLSGLIAVPDVANFSFPITFYQHGTSDCKVCVPSRYTGNGGEGELGLLFAGLGFVALLPDYVGMGDGRGFQTYVHEATTVTASLDFLTAAKEWLTQQSIKENGQLFITGYSQGGYASMAVHKAIETSHPELKVTAAAHLSGPYSLSGVMRDLVLQDKEYNYPAYLPNTILGLNEVSNDIYTDLNQIFKQVYVPDMAKYHAASITLSALNSRLITLLKTNNNNKVIAGQMLKDSIKQLILSDPYHPLNKALRDNDVFRWAPKTPTKIFYCKADDQVPYLNSVVAQDTMKSLGASDLQATDVLSTANHGTCFTPAITQTILFFLSKQILLSDVQEDINITSEIIIYPNPTADYVAVDNIKPNTIIELYDFEGKLVHRGTSNSNRYILDMGTMNAGQYSIFIRDKTSEIKKLVQKL